MECAGKRIIHVPSGVKEINFYNLSDVHLGSAACDKKKLAACIDRIKQDKYAYWFATGDIGEYISARDVRHDFSIIDKDVFDTPAKLGSVGQTLVDAAEKLFRPIVKRCLGVGIGNHEWSYSIVNNQESLQRSLALALNVPYLGYTAFFDTCFVFNNSHRRVLRHLLSHGKGAAQTKGGKLNSMLQYAHNFEADIYWVGHLHDKLADRVVSIGANRFNTELQDKVKLCVMSGSFLKTYAKGYITYAERKGYAPTYLGAARVRVTVDWPHSKSPILEYFSEV